MNQITSFLKRLVPSGPGFVAGALTAAVVFVANHFFHVHLADASVETALAPFVAFLVASMADEGKRLRPVIVHEASSLDALAAKLVHDVDPSSTLTGASLAALLTHEISSRLESDPKLVDDVLHLALGHLSAPVVAEAEKVIEAIEGDEPVAPVVGMASRLDPPGVVPVAADNTPDDPNHPGSDIAPVVVVPPSTQP